MKKIHFLFIAFIFSMATGCKSGSKKAYDFSEGIVKKEQLLTPDIQRTENNMGRFLQAEQYDSVVVAGEKMEKEFDDVISDIKGMSVSGMKEGEDFKNESIKYFEYLKKVYTYYKEIGQAPTKDAKVAKYNSMMEFVGDKEKVLTELRAAQLKFATANGFRLESKVK